MARSIALDLVAALIGAGLLGALEFLGKDDNPQRTFWVGLPAILLIIWGRRIFRSPKG